MVNTKVAPILLVREKDSSVQYSVFRINFMFSQAPKILQGRLTFTASFPGWLTLQRVDGPTIGRDRQLESIEFNKKVLVYGESSKVAFQILSPDFMNWYLNRPEKPILAFRNNECYCTIVENSPLSKDQVKIFFSELIERIKHSGSLGVSSLGSDSG